MGNEYISYATNSPRKVGGKNTQLKKKEVEVGNKQSHTPIVEHEEEPSEKEEISNTSILIQMRLFTFMIALTAFILAGCAAYFSVSGLATLFAGAFWSIVVMGGILEFGKLMATSFLYRYWKQASVFLRIYLTTAVFVLMLITSMGIFGYLSRAHIEQQGNIQDAVVEVERIDSQIRREHEKIDTLNQRIQSIESDDTDLSSSIERQESIRDSAWDMVQSDIDFEQSQIKDIQNNLKSQLESLDQKYELNLADLNSELDRIEQELQRISNEERGLFKKKQTELKDSLREQQSEILLRKDQLREKLDTDKENLRHFAYQQISVHQEKIDGYRQQSQHTIDEANRRINDLKENDDLSEKEKEERVDSLREKIDSLYSEIESLKDDKFEADSAVRLVETEVGPIKYVAEAVYGNTETNTVEKAVRFLIILIVFVFDPLAVSLVLAYNSLIMTEKRKETKYKDLDEDKEEVSVSKKPLFDKLKKVKTRKGEIRDLEGNKKMETDTK